MYLKNKGIDKITSVAYNIVCEDEMFQIESIEEEGYSQAYAEGVVTYLINKSELF